MNGKWNFRGDTRKQAGSFAKGSTLSLLLEDNARKKDFFGKLQTRKGVQVLESKSHSSEFFRTCRS